MQPPVLRREEGLRVAIRADVHKRAPEHQRYPRVHPWPNPQVRRWGLPKVKDVPRRKGLLLDTCDSLAEIAFSHRAG